MSVLPDTPHLYNNQVLFMKDILLENEIIKDKFMLKIDPSILSSRITNLENYISTAQKLYQDQIKGN